MKYLFILWLLVMFVSLIIFGTGFVKELLKNNKPFQVSIRLVVKYFTYLVLCFFPASIIGGLIGSENPFMFIGILLTWSALVIFGLIVLSKKNKNLLWLLVFPVLPSIIFFVMRLELQRESLKLTSA